MRNARFWETGPRGNPVKITLRPGQSLRHGHGGRDDEGWHWTDNRWTHEGDHVLCAFFHDGQDCDGRHSRGGESIAPLDKLAAGYTDEEGATFPDWTPAEDWQRDYTAESEGY